MKDIKDIYNINYIDNNIIYSLDMIRLKTYITYDIWNNLNYWLTTFYKEKSKFWVGHSISQFHYNYSVEVGEGKSVYIGFHHNNEKNAEFYNEYNLTIEFNPNKLKDSLFIFHILGLSGKWCIKSFDIAFDIRLNILDLIYDMSGRNIEKVESHGFDNKTIMLGKGNGRVKIYNKKRESDLNISTDLTRIEISRDLEDFEVRKIKLYKYDNNFPLVYTNNYLYSLSDYKDKTLFALLYSVQNGFPLRNLTKTYRKKIKDLIEGGHKIKFNNNICTNLIMQTIYFYFMKNDLIIWY